MVHRQLEGRPLAINSPIFTVLVRDEEKNVTGPLRDPVQITFRQLHTENHTSPQCAAWVYKADGYVKKNIIRQSKKVNVLHFAHPFCTK